MYVCVCLCTCGIHNLYASRTMPKCDYNVVRDFILCARPYRTTTVTKNATTIPKQPLANSSTCTHHIRAFVIRGSFRFRGACNVCVRDHRRCRRFTMGIMPINACTEGTNPGCIGFRDIRKFRSLWNQSLRIRCAT